MLGTPLPGDAKAPEGAVTSVRHIDHVTYVCAAENERTFCETWGKLGFHEHVRVHTQRFPAAHIALVSGMSPEYPWATMTGLSVTTDEESAISEYVRRYGEGVQHVAYNIDPSVDMDEVHAQMKAGGWNFMTDVLSYEDENGARLRQMFVAPGIPFGPFVEFIQRLEGADGKAFDGFDIDNIDGLYERYTDYSRHLESKR